MNLIVVIESSLVVLLFLVFNVKAQDDPEKTVIKPLHPSVAVIIGILSIMFSLTFLLLAYSKFCRDTSRDGSSDEEQIAQDVLQSVSHFSGIERTVVETLPFFRFSSLQGSKEGLECAICISKFEETEVLRMLPRCRHAFHITCIDKWLENHSSCPLCRYKFNVEDLTSFPFTNSSRYLHNSSNLSEEPNLELFVQREQDHYKSSRFNMVSNLQRLAINRKEEELLLQKHCKNGLHKFKHKIIFSDLIYKSRWSDLNSSDLMFLNSEMLNVTTSKRFSQEMSSSSMFQDEFRMNENILKIKEDIERKRLYGSKVSSISINPVSTSNFPNATNHDSNASTTSRMIDPAEKRSMSEIVHLSRHVDNSQRNHINESSLYRSRIKDERVKRLWLPIARRTVQWFSGGGGDLMHEVFQSNV